jgi:hypothetical protein
MHCFWARECPNWDNRISTTASADIEGLTVTFYYGQAEQLVLRFVWNTHGGHFDVIEDFRCINILRATNDQHVVC